MFGAGYVCVRLRGGGSGVAVEAEVVRVGGGVIRRVYVDDV